MNVQSPVLLASCDSVVNEIRDSLPASAKQHLAACSYDTYEKQWAWHKAGTILLAVAGNGDAEHATRFLQEVGLRRSPLRVALVCLKPNTGTLAKLEPHVAHKINWPSELDTLVELVQDTPVAATAEPKSADLLASRLTITTPSLLGQIGRLAIAAAHDVTVLLSGETGTGKTYLARMLHEHSPRRRQPFLMVPCGAQPSNLFESTFFGHVKGAYTGAHQARVGRFAAAGKGTILLDEVDALGLEQQASLLRVIETGEYELVGGNETLHSEARIIVACNSDLEEEVAKGLFRQDLFYRLNVMSFHLPPLRQRRQDIPLLARDIVARFNAKFSKDLFNIADDAMDALLAYHWPGNIRQLENVLQEAVLVCDGPELMLGDLPELPPCADAPNFSQCAPTLVVGAPRENSTGDNNGNGQHSGTAETLLRGRADYERGLIQKTLNDCGRNRSKAARVLGVSRVTVHKKLKQYGLSDSANR
jgi:two-component system response regulator HydG